MSDKKVYARYNLEWDEGEVGEIVIVDDDGWVFIEIYEPDNKESPAYELCVEPRELSEIGELFQNASFVMRKHQKDV